MMYTKEMIRDAVIDIRAQHWNESKQLDVEVDMILTELINRLDA